MEALLARLPAWVRKAIVDFIEAFVATLLAFDFAFPADLASTEKILVAIGVAALHAVVSALRRNAPEAFTWLEAKFGVSKT